MLNGLSPVSAPFLALEINASGVDFGCFASFGPPRGRFGRAVVGALLLRKAPVLAECAHSFLGRGDALGALHGGGEVAKNRLRGRHLLWHDLRKRVCWCVCGENGRVQHARQRAWQCFALKQVLGKKNAQGSRKKRTSNFYNGLNPG